MFSLSFVILPHHRLTELPLLTPASTNQKVKEPHFSGLYAHCGFALHKRIVRYLLMLVSLRYRFLDYIPTPSVPLPVSSSHSHVASVDGGRSIHFFFPCGIDCIVPLSGLCEERTCEGSTRMGFIFISMSGFLIFVRVFFLSTLSLLLLYHKLVVLQARRNWERLDRD